MTSDSRTRTQKVVDRAAIGTLLGLGIGAATGNIGRGAAYGAGIGAATGFLGGMKKKTMRKTKSKGKSRKPKTPRRKMQSRKRRHSKSH
jgi:hypothetical protein